MRRLDTIKEVPFSDVNLSDPFFTSLRNSYSGFDDWFERKASLGEEMLISRDPQTYELIAMLYLKDEDSLDISSQPPLRGRRLKIGTFKVDFEHHTSLGKRLLATALRRFAEGDYDYVYITLFDAPNTAGLDALLRKYGFHDVATKGFEHVLAKARLDSRTGDPMAAYPFLRTNKGNDYLLAIYPEYHRRMFGDVELRSEFNIPIDDQTAINTIEKIYLTGAWNAEQLQPADHLVMYRTGDDKGPALYRSIVSAVCALVEKRNLSDFASEDEFVSYIGGRSVFEEDELDRFWRQRRYPWVLTMLFNFPLRCHPNRERLLHEGIIPDGERIVCQPLDKRSFKRIIELGGINEGYVID